MKILELIKLIDAGYTKEEIQAMNAPATEPDPAPDPEPKPAPDPAPAPAQDETMAAMLKEMQDLKKAVFAMNVMNAEMPAPKSVDDILAKAMEGGN